MKRKVANFRKARLGDQLFQFLDHNFGKYRLSTSKLVSRNRSFGIITFQSVISGNNLNVDGIEVSSFCSSYHTCPVFIGYSPVDRSYACCLNYWLIGHQSCSILICNKTWICYREVFHFGMCGSHIVKMWESKMWEFRGGLYWSNLSWNWSVCSRFKLGVNTTTS